jgi:hypothetical protein
VWIADSCVSNLEVRGTPNDACVSIHASKNKLMKIIDRWPMALIVFGITLTVVWVALLIWFTLHLLQLV